MPIGTSNGIGSISEIGQSAAKDTPVNSSVSVSSTAIRIVRPKSKDFPLAKRRQIQRRNSYHNINSQTPQSRPSQVIVTQYVE